MPGYCIEPDKGVASGVYTFGRAAMVHIDNVHVIRCVVSIHTLVANPCRRGRAGRGRIERSRDRDDVSFAERAATVPLGGRDRLSTRMFVGQIHGSLAFHLKA